MAIWLASRGSALVIKAGKSLLSMAGRRLRDRLTGGANGSKAVPPAAEPTPLAGQ
jgi:hypothetical protein